MTIQHMGFSKTFAEDHLTVGLVFPIESYRGALPTMENQVELARRIEHLGFSALWFRDVPLNDPYFGGVGQIYDTWVYMGYIAAYPRPTYKPLPVTLAERSFAG